MSKSLELSFLKAATAQKRGDLAEAERLYRAVLRHYPNNARARKALDALPPRTPVPLARTAGADEAAAQFELGLKAQLMGRLNDAGGIYEAILERHPDHAGANHNLGGMLLNSGQGKDAIVFLERAARVWPDNAGIQNDLGSALQTQGRLDEAAAAYRRAIELRPDYIDALSNFGNVLQEQRRFDMALACYDRALAIDPEHADGHFNKALLGMLLGDHENGWRLYEWRKKKRVPDGARTFAQPLWLGVEDIAGKSLFIHPEQGLGDVIQFVRYAPLARDRGAEVIVSVQSPLVPLLSAAFPGITVIGADAEPEKFDYHVPLLSLPLAFGTRIETIPNRVPYIRAEPERVRKWADRLGSAGLKIGICWQGSTGRIDEGRSFALSAFAGIAKLPGVRLISLHKGAGESQLEALPDGMQVERLGEDFDPPGAAFLDTAAVMAQCDLIITSDTAIAHLAGAMGRPVWVILKHFPYCRWMLDREDSPWYPSMRLFRQQARGDWRSAFAAVEAALTCLLEDRG